MDFLHPASFRHSQHIDRRHFSRVDRFSATRCRTTHRRGNVSLEELSW